MKLLFTTIFFTMLGFSNLAMAGSDHVALFKNVSGDLKIIRDKVQVTPKAGTVIFESDIIISKADAAAGIAFRDGTRLTVGPSSHIEISQYVFELEQKQYDFALYLKKGSAIYSSGKLGKLAPESVRINTPRAIVGVRGTRFLVKAE